MWGRLLFMSTLAGPCVPAAYTLGILRTGSRGATPGMTPEKQAQPSSGG